MTSRSSFMVCAIAGAAIAGSASAQTYTPIYSTGFNTSQGFVAGSVNGQNGWATFGTGTSDIVLNAPAGGEGDGAIKLTASTTNSYSWPAPFGAAWTSGNFYELRVSQKVYVPSGSTSTARPGSIVWDSTGTKILSGFYVQVDTGNMYLLVNNTANGTTANYAYGPVGVITKDQWVDVIYRFNAQSGYAEVVFGTTGGYVNSVTTPGSAADEVDYYLRAFGASPSGGFMFADSLVVDGLGTAFPSCGTATNACDAVSATGGCNTIACCDTVCQLQPECCAVAWDAACVGTAIPTCNLFVYNCSNPALPANNCATAPAVVSSLPALVAYDTTLASTDGPPEAGCNSGSADLPIHKDVWYRFQAPAAGGTLIASNCNTSTYGGTATFDSKIAAYDMGTSTTGFDPQTLPELYIGCNEDCNDPAWSSELTVQLTGGHYYLVRLGGYLGESGTGNIYIGVVPPPNPCDAANIINGVAGINTVTADSLYPDFVATQCAFTVGGQNISKAKFIKFTPAASGTITFQTCSDAGTSAATDSRLAAMTVCGDATTIIGCDDDGCAVPPATTPWTSKLQFTCTAGTTYYVAVGGFDAGWTGSNVEIIPPTAPACPADLNNDGQVNGADLGLLLGAWGPCAGCAADLNADGQVNGADLGLLLGAWGPCA